MRNKLINRFLAGTLSVIMAFSGLPLSASAKGNTTIFGEEETIVVSQDVLARENSFNAGWKFYLGTSNEAQNPNFDDSKWKNVTLPHDFSITQKFTTGGEAESGFLPGGTGWYRKSFTMPAAAAGKQVVLSFDGVYSDAYVYVNGQKAGEHHYGYTPFAFDITGYLTCDGKTENAVAVKAVNNIPSSRWYSGSGIYRDVTLFVTDPVHVDYNGMKITTPQIEKGKGNVNIAADIVNESSVSANVEITNTVYDGSTKVAESSANALIPAGQRKNIAAASAVVNNPKLWNVDHPALYTVKTEVAVDGVVVDTVENTFGFRYYSFDSSGFHLNGQNVKLNGVCLHHDQGALGSAASYDAMYRQLSIMKDMGANAIRTSHNPADEDFIAICDELGLLVIEELFDGWVDAKNGNSNDFSGYFNKTLGNSGLLGADNAMTWAEFAAKSVVKRDRNHPSIILWSLGNEVQEGTNWTNVGSYASIARNLIDWIKEEDTTRPTTSGDNNRGGDSRLAAVLNTIRNNGGVIGFNYANSASTLSGLAQNYGGGVVIASETASATNSRGQYRAQTNNASVDGRNHLTSYDTSSVSWGITAHDSIYNTYQYDCVAGEFVWTGFDYIGEPTPWNGTTSGTVSGGSGATPNSSYFGIVETTGFEKDSYYLYRSQWNKKETTLHLVTAWDSRNMMTSGGKTPVVIYSNAPIVKLYCNGTQIGTATRKENKSAAGHSYGTYTVKSSNTSVCTAVSASGSSSLYVTFNVTYAAGNISARAFESDGVTEIALSGNSGNNTVTTPGTVSKLIVRQNKKEIAADGSSLVYISADVTDAQGNPDTTAVNTINFSLSGNGEIVGVDNGDQATTAKYQQPSVLTGTTNAKINAYAGKALVIVRSTTDAGSFTVNVSSSGLMGGSASVTTIPTAGETQTGLLSYTMIRDYTVKSGTMPVLRTGAAGIMADGTEAAGTLTWEKIPADIYETPGDYTIAGVLRFPGLEAIAVSAKLHVIADVIAMRNVATATTPNTVPVLPDRVRGVLKDGTLYGEFAVNWEEVTAEQFSQAGTIVTVHGTASVFGEETLPVTISVRVAEAVNSESSNVAAMASSLEQDIAAGYQSDNLESVRNGVLKPGDNTNERWTNWKNRTRSEKAALTFHWDTAQPINRVNLYYYYDNCSAKPQEVVFEYSLNGRDYIAVEASEELVESYSLGAEYAYTFASPVNPVALRITLTQQNGTTGTNCVGLTECEIMTYSGKLEYNTSADLSAVLADGAKLPDFNAETLSYTAEGAVVTAETEVNAGITILPALENAVYILTISEDGSEEKTYTVTLTEKQECRHQWDAGVIMKEPTTEQEGEKTYTCTLCGVTKTEIIPKLEIEKKIPGVTVKVTKGASADQITMTGIVEDFENPDQYYEITGHGLVYISTSVLGAKTLTQNTQGRTKVNFTGYKADGSYSYTMKAANATKKYTIRAYISYKDASGREYFVYSYPCVTNYSDLK